MTHPPRHHPANPAQGVSEAMVEAATKELLAHGEFSSIPGNNEPNARIAARAALTAAIGAEKSASEVEPEPDEHQEVLDAITPHISGEE